MLNHLLRPLCSRPHARAKGGPYSTRTIRLARKLLAVGGVMFLSVYSCPIASAEDTGGALFSQCTKSEQMMLPALSGLLPSDIAGMVLLARSACRDKLVNTWNILAANGERLCPAGGRVTEDQLEMVFVDWARRYPQYLGMRTGEALRTAWLSAFPCRRP